MSGRISMQSILAPALFLLMAGSIQGAALQTTDDSEFSVQTWQVEDGLPSNSVHAIAQTPDGYLWLGTYEGLVRFDGLRFATLKSANSPGLENDRIFALTVDPRGALWIGTDGGGVTRVAGGQFKSYTARDRLGSALVLSLCVGW